MNEKAINDVVEAVKQARKTNNQKIGKETLLILATAIILLVIGIVSILAYCLNWTIWVMIIMIGWGATLSIISIFGIITIVIYPDYYD